MKSLLLLLFSLTINSLFSQQFVEKTDVTLTGVELCSSAFADVDGDNDLDLVITGLTDVLDPRFFAELYLNDGNGNFTPNQNMVLSPVFISAVAFADVDNDNDQDLMISGRKENSLPNTSLYLNDGTGAFELGQNQFIHVEEGSIKFGDVDNDLDLDVLICGRTNDQFTSTQTVLYKNDGNGNFSKANSSFKGVHFSSMDFADFDGDNDLDIVYSGKTNGSGEVSTNLYINDGSGRFTLENSVFEDVWFGAIAAVDVNNDNQIDLVVSGENPDETAITKLYINQGNLEFIENTSVPFPGVSHSTIAYSDVDLDNDMDLLISGSKFGSTNGIGGIYINDGIGNFSEDTNSPLGKVIDGIVTFADIDGDNDEDLLMCGWWNGFGQISNIYLNSQLSSTKNPAPTNLERVTINPNPATDFITLTSRAEFINPSHVNVYDEQGKLINERVNIQPLNKVSIEIDVSNLNTGLYFVHIISEGGIDVSSFIVVEE